MSRDTKVYIAAPFFTPKQLLVVEMIEYELSNAKVEFFSPRSEGTLKEMDAEERLAKMGDLFRSNIAHMDWCTHAIAVLDDYDKGVLFEMGYLYATDKKIIAYTNGYKGINVMLNEAIVSHCTVMYQIIPALDGIFKGSKTGDVT